jgi:hypothetical protein
MNLRNTKLIKPALLMAFTISLLFSNAQEIDVQGNLTSIVNGDATPSVTDSTDFGSVIIGNNNAVTFRVHNSDATNLDIYGSSITGSDASMFVITTVPGTPVTTGDSTDLIITFTPTSVGLKTAVVNIFSNDA